MPQGSYSIRVSVDGVPIPDSNLCRGVPNSGHCRFTVSLQLKQHRHLHKLIDPAVKFDWFLTGFFSHSYCNFPQTVWYRTPTIASLGPVSGPPGTVLYFYSSFKESIVNFILKEYFTHMVTLCISITHHVLLRIHEETQLFGERRINS